MPRCRIRCLHDISDLGFLLLVIAIVLSILLRLFAKRICPESTPAARTFRIASTLAPFLGLLYVLVSGWPLAIIQDVDSANHHRIQRLVLRISPYAINLLY